LIYYDGTHSSQTLHARRGKLKNVFQYGVDFVLTDLEGTQLWLLSRNHFNLWSIWDRHDGGPRANGTGKQWFEMLLRVHDFPIESAQLVLLTQPGFLWIHFNPVSFWIALIDGKPCTFVAAVNSTFGQRHSYFCALDGFFPKEKHHRLTTKKLMHVSPFQEVSGQYRFTFSMSETEIDIRILFENEDQGVLATLSGARQLASNASLMKAAIKRPLGAMRVVARIHWQATILYFKSAPFLKKQPAPERLISENQSLQGTQNEHFPR
jgi:DUF1365 family protein